MSTPTTQPIFLHEWTVPTTQTVDEVTERVENGQPVKVTRKVPKEVPVKMALKKLTRREARDADLFYGKEYNRFISMGFLPRSIMVNKHLDVSGGVLSEKERVEIAKLIERKTELEKQIVDTKDEPVRKELRAQVHSITSQIIELSSANEAVFAQTAETKAQAQLNTWLAFTLVYIEKDGKMVPYFQGNSFDEREAFMWSLEESNDEFYLKAVEKISLHVGLFARGVDSPEQFKLIEEEMAARKKAEDEKAKAEAPVEPEKPVEPAATPSAASA